MVGGSASPRHLRRLNGNGRYVLGNPSLGGRIGALRTSVTTDKRVAFELASPRTEDMTTLVELVESDEVTPVIDRRYPLSEVPDAHAYVESGRKIGTVVVAVGREAP